MRKLRKQAKELLQSANKVYHYRRDVIPDGRLEELSRAVTEVQELMGEKDRQSELQTSMDRLDALLRKIGGKLYPKTFWNDNIEVALVAAIIVIGIRTFFFQPFIIPTNSMFPTYSGMNAVIYESSEGAPSALTRIFRLATLGARHKAVTAEASGQVQIPFLGFRDNGEPVFYAEQVTGRKFFVLPAVRAQYTIFVDGVAHAITVPAEFDMHSTLARAFDLDGARATRLAGNNRFGMLQLEEEVRAGEDLLRFDITLGDALFVDRLSYHFRAPRAGEPFVFRTDDILEALGEEFPKYYIKRLAGVGGETLEIRESTLLVDGEPRDEVPAFLKNAAREDDYGGYIGLDRLGPDQAMKVPEGFFVALGDNSGNSKDSRYWGFVPERSVVGKAIFIYYPFTRRWGLAE